MQALSPRINTINALPRNKFPRQRLHHLRATHVAKITVISELELSFHIQIPPIAAVLSSSFGDILGRRLHGFDETRHARDHAGSSGGRALLATAAALVATFAIRRLPVLLRLQLPDELEDGGDSPLHLVEAGPSGMRLGFTAASALAVDIVVAW